MLVQHYLEQSAETYPDKTALICSGDRLSYAEIEEKANRLAHSLIQKGVERGDRVVIYLPNSVESVISVFAVLKASAVFVAINPSTKQDKLVYILNNCRAKALIGSAGGPQSILEGLQEKVSSLKAVVLTGGPVGGGKDDGARAGPSKRAGNVPDALGALGVPPVKKGLGACFLASFDELVESGPAERPECPNIDKDIACLIYTSGSTGEPKGVVSGHDNVNFASGSVISYLENTADDILINVLPLSFDYGLYQLLMTFRFGGTLVLERSFTFPAKVLKTIEEEKVTGFPGVPTSFSLLLQMDTSAFDLSSIRYMTNTAAALPREHIIRLRQRFPWIRIYSMYGLTESKRTLYLPPDMLDAKPGSVGIPIPGTEAWLEDESGRKLGLGETGELVVRGSHVMRGYWEDPELTAKVFKEGPTPGERVLYSGDLFRTDEDGFFYFVARKDDIIKSRGEKVPPKEVESVLYGMDGVVEAAITGVPDETLGRTIKAFVVSKDPLLNEKKVRRYCSKHLEGFMVPQTVEFRNELPKTENGKIKRKELV